MQVIGKDWKHHIKKVFGVPSFNLLNLTIKALKNLSISTIYIILAKDQKLDMKEESVQKSFLGFHHSST